MTHWAMVIDLRKCIECEACVHICNEANKPPPGTNWRQALNFNLNSENESSPIFITMSCMQCQDPPCLKVCPTGATHKKPNGIVDIDYQHCVGCGACILACPYNARSIEYIDNITSIDKSDKGNILKTESDRVGICTKCNFCTRRVEKGIREGLKPGIDNDATPLCAAYCTAEAIYFGDLDDPRSKVSQLISENNTHQINKKVHTKPSIFYILDSNSSSK